MNRIVFRLNMVCSFLAAFITSFTSLTPLVVAESVTNLAVLCVLALFAIM